MKTTISALSLPILTTAFLAGAAMPAGAEPAPPDPVTARFAELVPWLPKHLPRVSEASAFEEHKHFVYLAGRSEDHGTRMRLLMLRPDTLVVDRWPFDPDRHNLGKPITKSERGVKLAGGRTAQRMICAYQSPDGRGNVRIKAKGKNTAISVGDRRLHLAVPTDPRTPARIAIHSGDGQPILAERRLPDGIMPLGEDGMRLLDRWDTAYRRDTKAPWDEGTPSVHLTKAVESGELKPGRAVVLGCGTGTNALYLASKGFDVTAIDIAPTALTLAEQKAKKARLKVRWLLADVLAPPAGLEPFDVIFDRGCYHGVRRSNAEGFVGTARRLSKPGTQMLLLAGNANEERHYGPPRVKEEELRGDFSKDFDFIRLDTVRFNLVDPEADGALAWSVLLRRKETPGNKRNEEGPFSMLGSELPNVRLDAAKALGARGKEVIPALLKEIGSKDWRVRRAVTDAFGSMGEAAKPAVPALIRATGDAHPWVRDGAAAALGRIGDSSPEVVAALAKTCGDPNGWVRYTAGQALTRATKDPEILVPAAIAMLQVDDPFPRARGIGVGILKKHGKDHDGAIPALLNVLTNPSEGMFSATNGAVDALVACGAEDQVILDPLIALAKHKWWAHRITAVNSLAKLGDKAGPTIPMITRMAENDPHPKSRRAAQQALDKLTQPKP